VSECELPSLIVKTDVPDAALSLKVTVGDDPVHVVFKLVADPVPASDNGAYVGVRFAGPASVTLHDASTLVVTLNVVAPAPVPASAKSTAPALKNAPVRTVLRRFNRCQLSASLS
jgi:hypothetical protein